MNAHTLSTLDQKLVAWRRWPSPLGELLLARTDRGLAGVWFDGQKDHPGDLGAERENADDDRLQRTVAELDAYFSGQPRCFSEPLDLHGTAFQRGVWRSLLAIERGHTCSYADIARAVGASAAVRAVGAAIGRNPVSIIVPCHRVIGSGGALTGYAGGLERKRALLRLEQSGAAAPACSRALDEAA